MSLESWSLADGEPHLKVNGNFVALEALRVYGQRNVAQRACVAGGRVHHQQHATALLAEVLGDAGRHHGGVDTGGR